MTEYCFGSFRVGIDEKLTREWYDKAEQWDCGCGHCRNFLTLAGKRRLPARVLEILDGLGIPPEKATYVCELGLNEGGLCYEFSYRIAGSILSGDERRADALDWGDMLCFHESYPYGAPDFPGPHFDLGFFVTLPWVLEEAE